MKKKNIQTKGIILIMAAVLAVTSCSSAQDPKDTEPEVSAESTVPAGSDEHIDYDKIYSDILDNYHTALTEQWDVQTLGQSGINTLCQYCYESDPLMSIGYQLIDIDSNGIPELLIGTTSESEDSFTKQMIFDMYTVNNGQAEPLFQGWERSRYYLLSDYGIVCEGANSGFWSVVYLYDIEDGKNLKIREGVIYQYEPDCQTPWYFTKDEDDDTSNDEPISEETANEKLESYKNAYIQTDLIPFTDYHPE